VRRSVVFDHADWVYELKYDGFRALAYVGDGKCRLISRKGNQLKRFDELCRSIPAELKATSAVIDGEVVALNQSGSPAFYDLLKRRNRIVYFAFDLLWLNGEDLRERPLLERKKLLRSIIPREPFCIGYVGFTERQPGTAQYCGFDVVPSVISRNQRNYASRNIDFQLYSGNPDELPKADLLLAKDVLQHWSNQSIAAFLPVLARYRFALITNDVNPRGPTANIDIEDGGYRYLDLRLPPFQLSATEVYSFTSNDMGFFNQLVLGGVRSTLRWSVTFCRPVWIKRVLLVESNS
jgi:hypothetical protein